MPRHRLHLLVARPDLSARPGLLFLAGTLLAAAQGQSSLAAQRAAVRVSARVAAYFRVQLQYQAPGIAVTPADVRAGYIDVPAASRFVVSTNSPDA